jgi:hypothetical protein
MVTSCFFADSVVKKKTETAAYQLHPRWMFPFFNQIHSPSELNRVLELSSERVQFWNTEIEHTNIT